jgi:hypothetical protein
VGVIDVMAAVIGWRAVVCWLDLAPGEQPPDTGADGGEALRHLLIGRWGVPSV